MSKESSQGQPERLAPEDRRRVGQEGESIALAHLETVYGYRCLAQNVYFRVGELDIVMLDGEVLVFVEVRGRWSRTGLRGEDSITRGKQQRLTRAATLWLQRNPEYRRHRARFDVVSVDLRARSVLGVYRNAFSAVC